MPSPGSRGQKSKVTVLAGLAPPGAPREAPSRPLSLLLVAAGTPWCPRLAAASLAHLCFLLQGSEALGLEPTLTQGDLILRSSTSDLCKDPFPKQGHIHRGQELGLELHFGGPEGLGMCPPSPHSAPASPAFTHSGTRSFSPSAWPPGHLATHPLSTPLFQGWQPRGKGSLGEHRWTNGWMDGRKEGCPEEKTCWGQGMSGH